MSGHERQYVTFQCGYNRVTFFARRLEVLTVLTSASVSLDEAYFEFQGTQHMLLSAGVAHEAMFAGIKSGMQLTRTDEFGDRYMLARRRDHWTLGLRMANQDTRKIPTDVDPKASPWWKKRGAAAEAETAVILRRLCRPARGCPSE